MNERAEERTKDSAVEGARRSQDLSSACEAWAGCFRSVQSLSSAPHVLPAAGDMSVKDSSRRH